MRALTLLVCTLAYGCASGASAPVLTPAEADVLYARYTGSWNLTEEFSDPGSAALATEVRATLPGDPKSRPEISSRTIRPTYQRAGQARDQVAGQMDRDAMRQTIMMAGRRPETLSIELSAAGMQVKYDNREPWMLPADGSRVDIQEDLSVAKVRLIWENGIPIIEREVDNAGVIREVLETAPNGSSLWLTRQVVMGTEAWQPAQFTYGR
jgi:hypothetical protein